MGPYIRRLHRLPLDTANTTQCSCCRNKDAIDSASNAAVNMRYLAWTNAIRRAGLRRCRAAVWTLLGVHAHCPCSPSANTNTGSVGLCVDVSGWTACRGRSFHGLAVFVLPARSCHTCIALYIVQSSASMSLGLMSWLRERVIAATVLLLLLL